jgi:beta-galactosidase
MYSRRSFLKTGATAAAASLFPSSSLRASIATLGSHAGAADGTQRTRQLADEWEFLQGSLGGPWETWHSEEVAAWQQVAIPHCFNAYDGCDPDVPYYRGNGWYRTHVPIANPFKNGRTLLHFEGAGQTTAVYVGEKLAGKHIGGYDEFVFDITDLVPDLTQTAVPAANATPHLQNRKRRSPTEFRSRCSAITRAISIVCPPTSATSASTVACTVM